MATTQQLLDEQRIAQKKSQDLAYQQAKAKLDQQKSDTTLNAEKLAQETYVNKMQQEKTLPGVLAQSGLSNQGYAESTANNINNTYQKALDTVQTNKGTQLNAIDKQDQDNAYTRDINNSNIDATYKQNLASYEDSLAKARLSAQTSASKETAEQKKTRIAQESKANLAKVASGLNSVQFDPYAGRKGEDPLAPIVAYLNNAVNQGLITEAQANDLYKQWGVNAQKHYGSSFGTAEGYYKQ